MDSYDSLRDEYPEVINLEQLRVICKIAKRSAKYLLENGIIPFEDTGRKTWRYLIKLEDVILYLRRRDQHGSMIPRGESSSRYASRKDHISRRSFSHLITPDGNAEQDVAEYFRHIYADHPDVLGTADIVAITGLQKATILKLLQSGGIKSLMVNNQYQVPKPFLIEFVTSRRFLYATSNSELFKKILGGYEIWKIAK